jgi:hypothetical protein
MPESIESIDPAHAHQILTLVIRSYRNDQTSPELTPDLQKELASAFGLSQTASEPASEEELTRQALTVLAEDPDRRAAIETMAAQPTHGPQKFEPLTTIALTTAVMIVLQTHVRFERSPDGKWTVRVEKKPTSDALLKGLVQKLVGSIK